MDILQTYYQEIDHRMKAVLENEKSQIQEAASMMDACIEQNRQIFFFGTGHSYIVGQEVFARAGGYAGFIPILENELGMNHPFKSTLIERTIEYADVILGLYDFHPGDIIFMTSNSGRNQLLIELAIRLKKLGVHIIAITSLRHSSSCESRHASGLRLFEMAELVLDNQSIYGDACITHDEQTKTGPTSTIMNCFLIHLVVSSFVQLQIERGKNCPVFRSSNMDHADTFNKELFKLYK